jgi:hypothetical protein
MSLEDLAAQLEDRFERLTAYAVRCYVMADD